MTTSSNTTRAAFEKLKTQVLIDHLIAEGVELEVEEIAIFREHKIDGEALIEATKDDLIGFGIPGGGVVLKIMKRIPNQ